MDKMNKNNIPYRTIHESMELANAYRMVCEATERHEYSYGDKVERISDGARGFVGGASFKPGYVEVVFPELNTIEKVPEEDLKLLEDYWAGMSDRFERWQRNQASKFESAQRKRFTGRMLGESIGRAKEVISRMMNEAEYKVSDEDMEIDNTDYDDNPKSNPINSNILQVKKLLGWNPVGGISIVNGTFKPEYDPNYTGAFKPMSIEQFIKSAYHCCTAEAHDVVNASATIVGGNAYLADSNTFSGLVNDDYMDYPEYYMHEVVLVFVGDGENGFLILMQLLHDSYTGHSVYTFDDVKGRDYVLSKILSSYPFLRDYVDDSDKHIIRFSLPPSLSREIEGAADKDGQRQPSLKDDEWAERHYYDTWDDEVKGYNTRYNIDVKNAYKDRFGGGKEFVG